MNSLGGPELVMILVSLLVAIPWIGSLIHCLRNKKLSDLMRVVGVMLIVFLGVVGSVIYLFLPRESNAR